MEGTMTTTPYADHWREHTRERMERLGLDACTVGRITGLDELAEDALNEGDHDSNVSLDVAGPIDELLAAREGKREARLVQVHVDLGALDGKAVHFTAPDYRSTARTPRTRESKPDADGPRDERRTWRQP
jgi:hypothetical protein